MKPWIKNIVLLVAGAIAFYYITLAVLPNFIYAKAKSKLTDLSGSAINTLNQSPLIDASSRVVVMPNPDFIYLASFYDLSEGPLRLTGNMPDSIYWSVAMYHPNTVNWYIKNDMEYEAEPLDLKIQYSDASQQQTTNNAFSEKQKGFMLIRVLVTDRTAAQVEAYQQILDKVRLDAI